MKSLTEYNYDEYCKNVRSYDKEPETYGEYVKYWIDNKTWMKL